MLQLSQSGRTLSVNHGAPCWLTLSFMLSYTTKEHLPRDCAARSGLGPHISWQPDCCGIFDCTGTLGDP